MKKVENGFMARLLGVGLLGISILLDQRKVCGLKFFYYLPAFS